MKEGQGSRPSLRELASQKVVNLNEFRARREDLRPKKQQVEVKPKPELIGDKIIDINAVREERLERRIAPLLKAYLLMPLTPEERKQAIEIQMKSMGRYASLVLEPRNPIADSDKRSVIDIMAQGRRKRQSKEATMNYMRSLTDLNLNGVTDPTRSLLALLEVFWSRNAKSTINKDWTLTLRSG